MIPFPRILLKKFSQDRIKSMWTDSYLRTGVHYHRSCFLKAADVCCGDKPCINF